MSAVVPAGNFKPNEVLRILVESVLTEDGLQEKLVKSLIKAKALGKIKLKSDIYDYFNAAFGKGIGWPTNVVDYMEYVKLYMTQVPMATLSKDKLQYVQARIFKSPEKHAIQPLLGFYERYQQCVYYDICHFYWLINQKVDGTTLQSNQLFASWVKMFGLGQGIFLNTPESLTTKSLLTFIADPLYNVREWYLDNKDDWGCWNQFFCRQFNDADPATGLSPLRPITDDPYTITAPADCTYQAVYSIDERGMVMDSNGNPISYKFKNFTIGCSVQELLGANCRPFWKDFYGGTFIHYFLSPYDYHRFHTPVAGIVNAMETINGQNYLVPAITDDGDFDAPDDATDGYEFKQERGLIIVENEDLGKVACLPIGMAQVSGVHMYKDQLLYREVIKGQEFGYFLFGGSDIILVISKPVDQLEIMKEGDDTLPIHFQYGTPAVICKNE